MMDSIPKLVNRYIEQLCRKIDSQYAPNMGHRLFKQRLYPEFARIAQALASDRRLELIDLLAQAPRHVDALAAETDMSLANVSQHLQVLRAAHLVETEKQGTKTIYRLAGDDVLRLWVALRDVAQARLPEVDVIARQFAVLGADDSALTRAELATRSKKGELTLIDVRPRVEYESGHLPGAVSIPPDELERGLEAIPPDRPVVAYCRGPYCLYADEAVALLRSRGFDACRVEGGWTDWLAERRPTSRESD